MSKVLKRPYIITWYKEVLKDNQLKDEAVIKVDTLEIPGGVIGSNTMDQPWRARSPKLKTNVNGTNELTFQLYTSCDGSPNPLIPNLINESKIVLNYKDKDYHFIIRNSKKDSNNKTYTVTATDAHIVELSRNGYDVTLDAVLMNNTGTVTELGEKILKDSGWSVDKDKSDLLTELTEELLVQLNKAVFPDGMTDPTGGMPDTIYAFISCCKNRAAKFQYYQTLPTEKNKNGALKYDEKQGLLQMLDNPQYVTSNTASKQGIYFPMGYTLAGVTDNIAERPVWTHRSRYNPILDKIVYQYNATQEGTPTIESYTETKYFSPDLIENLVTNSSSFKTTEGWSGQYIAPKENTYNNKKEEYAPKIEVKTSPDLLAAMATGTYDQKTEYTPYLCATFPKPTANVTPVLINSGFYDNRYSIKNLESECRFVVYWKLHQKDAKTPAPAFNVTIGTGDYDLSVNHYISPSEKEVEYFSFDSDSKTGIVDEIDTGYKYTVVTLNKDYASASEREYQKKKIYFFITLKNQTEKTTLEFEDFQCFRYIPDTSKPGQIIKPEQQLQLEEDGAFKTNPSNYISTKTYYYDIADNQNHQSAMDYKYLYTSDSKEVPNYKPYYSNEKVRSVTVKKSNYYNGIQSLCEAFECWAEFNTEAKTVAFKKLVGTDQHTGFKYGVNLKSSTRTYDSKAITTKLIVADNTNSHAQNGFCSITRAGANRTQDNCIYNFDYYRNKEFISDDLYVKAQIYYEKLREINSELIPLNDTIAYLSTVLARKQAEVQVAELGVEESEEEYQKAVDSFYSKTGFDYTEIASSINNNLWNVSRITGNGQTIASLPVELGAVGKIVSEGGKDITYTIKKVEYMYCTVKYGGTIPEEGEGNWTKDLPTTGDLYTNSTLCKKITVTYEDNSQIIKRYSYDTTGLGQDNGTTQVEITEYYLDHLNGFTPSRPTVTENGLSGTWRTEVTNATPSVLQTESIAKSFYSIAEYFVANQTYKQDLEKAKTELNNYKDLYDSQYALRQAKIDSKNNLNKEFFQLFGRFIQEGTWSNNDYNDPEKYYTEALKVSRESAMPKVTYSFSVLDMSNFEDYETFDIKIGDKTWVEDVEVFGSKNGYPVREEVIITEVTYDLEDPSKNSIKVQNYSDQFKDLFQKITATTQSIQNSQGSWEKAGQFVDGDSTTQAKFLQNALNDAETIISNAADQTVIWDNTGITVTDSLLPSRQLRLVGGAILIRDEEEGRAWKTGLTSKGISASLITSGQVNTGIIQIMNGDQPYFRWDDLGITAYKWESGEVNPNLRYNFDTKSGVRFDRFGIYGFNNKSSEGKGLWAPTSLDEINDPENGAVFALTWQGLFLNVGTGLYKKAQTLLKDEANGDKLINIELKKPIFYQSNAMMGKTNDYIYNAWSKDGYPYYINDEDHKNVGLFTKIFAVGAANNETLAIYSDGTLVTNNIRLTGEIGWSEQSSPVQSLYHIGKRDDNGNLSAPDKPENGTKKKNYPKKKDPDADENRDPTIIKDSGWHTVLNSSEDLYYSKTDDAGANWSNPILLTGRSIISVENKYYLTTKEATLDQVKEVSEDEWQNEPYPILASLGKAVWIRTRDHYNAGDWSAPRYTVSYSGLDGHTVQCFIESSEGSFFEANTNYGSDETELTALLYIDGKEQSVEGTNTNISYLWKKDGVTIDGKTERTLTVKINESKNSEFQCIITINEGEESQEKEESEEKEGEASQGDKGE